MYYFLIQRKTCIPNSIYDSESEKEKIHLIGCHFVLFTSDIKIQGNINSDCKIIFKHHLETIFLQPNPPRNISSAINVHKMLLTCYKIQANLIKPDGPYFMLRRYNNMLLNESPRITFTAIT